MPRPNSLHIFFHPQVSSRTSSLDSSTNGGSQRSNIKYTSQPSLHSIGNRAREEMMGDHTEETLSNRAHEEMLAGRAREGGHTPPYLPARLDLPKRSQEVATRPDLLLPLPLNVSHQRPSRSNSESKSTRQNNMDIVEVKTSRRPSLCRQEHVRQESVGRPPWFPRESTPQPSEMLSSGVLDFSSPQESRERSSRSRVQVTIVCFFPITLLSLLKSLISTKPVPLGLSLQNPPRRPLFPPPALRAQTSSDCEPWEHSRSSSVGDIHWQLAKNGQDQARLATPDGSFSLPYDATIPCRAKVGMPGWFSLSCWLIHIKMHTQVSTGPLVDLDWDERLGELGGQTGRSGWISPSQTDP